MNDFLLQIKMNLEKKKLSDTEKEILSKLVYKPFYFLENNATYIAGDLYTNTTVLNRFFKKCGFESYTDFYYTLKHIKNEKQVYNEIKNNQVINSSVKVFFNKKYTYFLIAKGASIVSCLYLQRQLLIIGYNAIIIDELNLVSNNETSKLIVISQSGNSLDLISFIHNIKEKSQTEILSITKNNSTIAKLSNYSICHDIKLDRLDKLQSEQQMHMLYLINGLIKELDA